jgi:hypothetical protein
MSWRGRDGEGVDAHPQQNVERQEQIAQQEAPRSSQGQYVVETVLAATELVAPENENGEQDNEQKRDETPPGRLPETEQERTREWNPLLPGEQDKDWNLTTMSASDRP